jgi:hypothetical protein
MEPLQMCNIFRAAFSYSADYLKFASHQPLDGLKGLK